MGDGRIFLKSLRDASFNKDLSNEPTFGRIHLAGLYLSMRIAHIRAVVGICIVLMPIRIRIWIGIKTMPILESGSYSEFFHVGKSYFFFFFFLSHARTLILETSTRAYRHEDPPRSYGASLWSSEGPNNTESRRLSVQMLRNMCCSYMLLQPRQAS